MVTDLNLEPFAVKVAGLWTWRTLPSATALHTAPWLHFLGWAATAILVLVFTTPWLISKNPARQQSSGFLPLFLWLVVNLVVGSACAMRGLWDAAWVGAYLHGAAADEWSKENGDRGLLAHEVADRVPRVLAHTLCVREDAGPPEPGSKT